MHAPLTPVPDPDPVVTPFPAERVQWARTRNDQVAVTHLGQTTVYASPAALHDAVLAARAPLIAQDRDRAGRHAVKLAVEAALKAEHAAWRATLETFGKIFLALVGLGFVAGLIVFLGAPA
jgi:hypothetical protein